jgi:hypothetical protein
MLRFLLYLYLFGMGLSFFWAFIVPEFEGGVVDWLQAIVFTFFTAAASIFNVLLEQHHEPGVKEVSKEAESSPEMVALGVMNETEKKTQKPEKPKPVVKPKEKKKEDEEDKTRYF